VAVGEDALAAGADLGGHEQAQVPHQGRAELVVARVGAVDVDPEALAGQTAAVSEGDLEVELGPVLGLIGHRHTRNCRAPEGVLHDRAGSCVSGYTKSCGIMEIPPFRAPAAGQHPEGRTC
jgi:hypothetical protein